MRFPPTQSGLTSVPFHHFDCDGREFAEYPLWTFANKKSTISIKILCFLIKFVLQKKRKKFIQTRKKLSIDALFTLTLALNDIVSPKPYSQKFRNLTFYLPTLTLRATINKAASTLCAFARHIRFWNLTSKIPINYAAPEIICTHSHWAKMWWWDAKRLGSRYWHYQGISL